MRSYYKIITLGAILITVFVSWYSVAHLQKKSPNLTAHVQTLGAKFITPSHIFTWKKTPVINTLADFFKPKTAIKNIPLETIYPFGEGSIIRLSDHSWRIKTNTNTWIIFDKELTQKELQSTLNLPLSYQADYWILQSQAEFIPSMFPVPRQGVLVLNSKKPSKFWRTWSEKNKIPVIPVASFGDRHITIIDQKILLDR